MRPPQLHIISPDVPYPPDYGGMVDVYYKVKFLYEAGVEIYLHCYAYGRAQQEILNKYCKAVYYYPRKTGIAGISLTLPYMLYSRRSDTLLQRLLQIKAPILFEGVHTAYYLDHPGLKERVKIMRNQNLEQDYYAQLAKKDRHILRKLYYKVEAKLLKQKEACLHSATAFFTVARHDHAFFKNLYPEKVHAYLPSFQPYTKVVSLTGKGSYVLYHGNLGHVENEEAVLFLLEHVIPQLDIPFIIAGRMPTTAIRNACSQLKQVQLIADPDMQDMENLIAGAQVHVLPTFQATGLKLKLLHALFNGRHVIVNQEMVTGTGLQDICTLATGAADFVQQINKLMQQPFTEQDITERQEVLLQHYDNRKNAASIKSFLIATHPE